MKNPAARPVFLSRFLLGAAVLASFPLDAAESKKAAPVPLDLEQPAAATPWSRYGNWTATDWKDYNTLVKTASPAYVPPPRLAGSDALYTIEGDPKNGEKLAFDRTRGGSCVACHVMGKTTPALPAASAPICPRLEPGGAPTSGCSIMCTTRAASTRNP